MEDANKKLADQKKILADLHKQRPKKEKTFATQLNEETSTLEKLQTTLNRLETQAEAQKKELIKTATLRQEQAKEALRELGPKLSKLEEQYAAQQLELASVGATREIEATLLERSIACMEEGTEALLASLEEAKLHPESQTGVRVLERRSQRLVASVRAMETDVVRAKDRLTAASRMNDARRSARAGQKGGSHRRTASTQMRGLAGEMETLREHRKKTAEESSLALKELSKAMERARSEASKEANDEMRQTEERAKRRRGELEEEARRMEAELEAAESRCRRGGARKRLFEKEFEMLKLGLDERRTEHEERMKRLRIDIETLENHLEGRRARTRAEREDALLRMENSLRTELENKWRATLEKVKTESAERLDEEERQAKESYQTVVNEVGTLLHEEYKEKLVTLDQEHTTRQRRVAVFEAQIDALTSAAEEARAKLITNQARLESSRTSVDNERRERRERYEELRGFIRKGWEDQKTSLQDRVNFFLRTDEVASYGTAAEDLYRKKIEDLELQGPILLCIKKREEMIVRMESVTRYARNPEQAIKDGTAQLLQRVGFTLPTPMSVHEASAVSASLSSASSKREKIRREAACHKLLEQWRLCQRVLSETTNELQNNLDQYSTQKSGEKFTRDGVTKYQVEPTEELTAIGNELNLSRFTHIQVQY